MSIEAIIPETILQWDRFLDSNGKEVPKLFLIVGAHADRNFLAVKVTSKKRWREYQPADDADYYYIPGGKLEWFKLDTWVLFTAPQEFNRVGAEREMAAKKLRIMGCLRHQMANEICNRMRRCEDLSGEHISLLGPPVQAPPS